MSQILKPSSVGMPDIQLTKCREGICRHCGDKFDVFRWSKFFCPDCDLRRMAKIDAGFKAIQEKLKMTYLKSSILRKCEVFKPTEDQYYQSPVEYWQGLNEENARLMPIILELLDDREELLKALGRVQDYLAFDLHSAPLKLSDALTASEERMKRLAEGE